MIVEYPKEYEIGEMQAVNKLQKVIKGLRYVDNNNISQPFFDVMYGLVYPQIAPERGELDIHFKEPVTSWHKDGILTNDVIEMSVYPNSTTQRGISFYAIESYSPLNNSYRISLFVWFDESQYTGDYFGVIPNILQNEIRGVMNKQNKSQIEWVDFSSTRHVNNNVLQGFDFLQKFNELTMNQYSMQRYTFNVMVSFGCDKNIINTPYSPCGHNVFGC